MNSLLSFSLSSISSLFSFTSTYGVLLLFIGLIILGIKFYKNLKIEFLSIAFICTIEIFVSFLLDPENVHTSYFFLYTKLIVCIIFIFRMSVLYRQESLMVLNQLLIIFSSTLISVFSINSILNKSLGKISSENYKNQYVLMREESLSGSKIIQKIRLEVYNKQDDSKVKVMHDSEKESVDSVISKIEDLDTHFWEIENKFLEIKDLK